MFNQILQPGESRDIGGTGSYVRVDLGTDVKVVTEGGESAETKQGETVSFKQFKSITVTNSSVSAERIKIRVSGGLIISSADNLPVQIDPTRNSVSVENAADIGAAISVSTGDVIIDDVTVSNDVNLALKQHTLSDAPDVPVGAGADVGSVGLVAANANREQLMIQAEGPADEVCLIRLGGATTAPGRGVKLYCGKGLVGSHVFTGVTGAVRAYNEGGQVVSVTVTEVVK